jgi:hypothetical protein
MLPFHFLPSCNSLPFSKGFSNSFSAVEGMLFGDGISGGV